MENARRKLLYLIIISVVVAGGLTGGGIALAKHRAAQRAAQIAAQVPAPLDPSTAFLLEVYDKIVTNYWDKVAEDKLSELFRLAVNKATGGTSELASHDRAGVEALVKTIPQDQVAKVATIVLANLQPFGRSGMLTSEQKTNLVNNVSNADPNKGLYAALDLPKDASTSAVEEAYKKKSVELSKDKTEEGKKKLEEVAYAHKVLTETRTKTAYDKAGVSPTVYSILVSPTVAYLRIEKFSPQTFSEFVQVANDIKDRPGLDSLIVDLRDNEGGAIDTLQYFLGPFIGPGQYGYEFFHQGDYVPYKTKTGFLASLQKFKKVVVLTNDKTQSSAEVMASSLKKYHAGVVVGTKTKGWGTIEQLFPMDHSPVASQSFSMLLVQSLTVRDDTQTIEGRGVDPNIDITAKDWQRQLLGYFNYQPLIDAVAKVWKNPPKML